MCSDIPVDFEYCQVNFSNVKCPVCWSLFSKKKKLTETIVNGIKKTNSRQFIMSKLLNINTGISLRNTELVF